jgi:hypothetical protein
MGAVDTVPARQRVGVGSQRDVRDRTRANARVSDRSRASRFCAALLAFGWVALGIAGVAHDLAHEAERGLDGHVERSTVDPLLSWVPAHRHGHTHASGLSDVSIVKAPKFEVQALSLAVRDLAPASAGLRWTGRPTFGRAGPGSAALLGPRAPPIS